jgi:hypothetical protein
MALLLIIIVIAILILAIIGLGWQTFFYGVQKGADKLGLVSLVKNVTRETQKTITDISQNASSKAIKDLIINNK